MSSALLYVIGRIMQDGGPERILTRRFTKIPHALSYVTDAKTLSLAFQDVPQFDLLRLDFWCWRVTDALLSSVRPRQILWLSVGSPHLYFPCDADIELAWFVNVCVCRRRDVDEVGEWLEAAGLKLAREWLIDNARVEGKLPRPSWHAYFVEKTGEFSIEHKV